MTNHQLLLKIRKKIDGMKKNWKDKGKQYVKLYQMGYNEALSDILNMLKKYELLTEKIDRASSTRGQTGHPHKRRGPKRI